MLPWEVEDARGTIFVMAHGRTEAFDQKDARLMAMLADFAAMGYRQQKQQARLITQERALAAAQMANQLAHEINNPLQSITNIAYLVADSAEENLKELSFKLSEDVHRLSGLVKKILAVPIKTVRL